MRILISSNAPWAHTGYGGPVNHLGLRLRELGHEVAYFAWYGLAGGMLEANGMRVYPVAYDPWGNDIVGEHVRHFRADVVLTMHDLWVTPEDYRERIGVPWLAWLPVDHEPIPPKVLARAHTADYPLIYSRAGTEDARRAGLERARYVPIGIDTGTYAPGDRADARRRLGWPEGPFTAAIVAANNGSPSRKGFAEQIQAFVMFRQRHHEARLYIHTDRMGMREGVKFDPLIRQFGLAAVEDGGCVEFVDQYRYVIGLPEAYMADVYRAADVLLSASYSEGFGIPIIEAQACGTPVITNRWTAMGELTGNGISVDPAQTFWTWQDSYWAVPSECGIWRALEEIARWPEELKATRSRQGVQFAREFDWSAVVERFWVPLLDEVQDGLKVCRLRNADGRQEAGETGHDGARPADCGQRPDGGRDRGPDGERGGAHRAAARAGPIR